MQELATKLAAIDATKPETQSDEVTTSPERRNSTAVEDEVEEDQNRKIDHLILAIHGLLVLTTV
jgi:hypothetical protein